MKPSFDPPPVELNYLQHSRYEHSSILWTPPYDCVMHLKYETIGSTVYQTPGIGDLYMPFPDRPPSHGGRIDPYDDLDAFGWKVASPDEEVRSIGPMPMLSNIGLGFVVPYTYSEGPGADTALSYNGYKFWRGMEGWISSNGLGTVSGTIAAYAVTLMYTDIDADRDPYDWRYILEFCLTKATGGTFGSSLSSRSASEVSRIRDLNKMWRLTIEFEATENPRYWTIPGLPTSSSTTELEVRPTTTSPTRYVMCGEEIVDAVRSRNEVNRVEGIDQIAGNDLRPHYTKQDYEAGHPWIEWPDSDNINGVRLNDTQFVLFGRFEVYVPGNGVADAWELEPSNFQGEARQASVTAPYHRYKLGADHCRFGPVDYYYESGIATFEIVDNAPFMATAKCIDYAFCSNVEFSRNAGDFTILDDDPATGYRVMAADFIQDVHHPSGDGIGFWGIVADIDPQTLKITIRNHAEIAPGIQWDNGAHEAVLEARDPTDPLWNDHAFSDWQWHDIGIVGASRDAAVFFTSDPIAGVRCRMLWVNEDGTWDADPFVTLDRDLELRPIGQWCEYHGQMRHCTKLPDGRILAAIKGEDSRGIARILTVDAENRTLTVGPHNLIAESQLYFESYRAPAGHTPPEYFGTFANIQMTAWDSGFSVSLFGDRYFVISGAAGGYTARAPQHRLYRINDDETITYCDWLQCYYANSSVGGVALNEDTLLSFDYTNQYYLGYRDNVAHVAGGVHIIKINFETEKFEAVYGLGPMEDLPYYWTTMFAINENMAFALDRMSVCDLRRRFPLVIPALVPNGPSFNQSVNGLDPYSDFDVVRQDPGVSDREGRISRRPGG